VLFVPYLFTPLIRNRIVAAGPRSAPWRANRAADLWRE
jgi:hypothetical protein